MSLLDHWPDLLTVQEAAEILRAAPAQVGGFIKAGEITVTVKPELSGQVEARVIGGRKYILIPAGEGVEVNGLPVELDAEGAAPAAVR